MNGFFWFLLCLLAICILIGFGSSVWAALEKHRHYVNTLERDVKVKDRLIAELKMEITQRVVAQNLAETVAQAKARRHLRLIESDRPALLRPQI